MKSNRNTLALILLGAFATTLALSGSALAVNVISLTGYWQDDNGNFIEIQRNGPNAIAVMQSEQGRSNWMRGSMDLSGKDIYLVKKRGTRTVGTVRGDLVRGTGVTRIRWNSGRVWRKSSQQAYNNSLHTHDHYPGILGFGGTTTTVNVTQLPGRWQTGNNTVVDVTQDGHSLNVRVVSRQDGGHGHRHPWTTGHGRISDSRLSLDCYNGTHLSKKLSGTYVSGNRGQRQIKWSNGDVWIERSQNLRLVTQPVTAVCNLPVNVIGAATPTFKTSTWEYQGGGYFHRHNDQSWHEYDSRGQERHRYREIERTKVSVTLLDDRRRISVQLRKNECLFRQGSSEEWRRLSQGRFASRTPDVHGSHAGHQHRQHATQAPAARESVEVNVGVQRFFQGLFGGRRN